MKLKQLLCVLLTLKLALARYAFVPKFFGQDSAVIIDTDKPLPPVPHGKHYYHRFPVYQIIQPLQPTQSSTTTTTSTTSRPDDEFPRDLLVLAQRKLGLKSLDEIPSISELGELLGTDTAEETISYIRQLTASEQGIALMKAYMETDDNDADDDSDAEENVDVAAATADLTVVDDDSDDSDINTAHTNAKPGFFERMASYLNIYNLLPQKQTSSAPERRLAAPPNPHMSPAQMFQRQRPYLMRSPLPYHYPIPLRPATLNGSVPSTSNTTAVSAQQTHASVKPVINTPKAAIIPLHIQQLSKFSNIPPQQLAAFLERKPKLAELAKRINNVALSNGGNTAVNSQLINAVKTALEQDNDLRRLLSDTNTLK